MVTGLFITGFPLCILISCSLYLSYYYQLRKRKVHLPTVRHGILILCCSYVLLVIAVTLVLGFDWFPSSRHYNLRILVWLSSPPSSRSIRVMRQLLYNIFMFIPLGLLYPLVFPSLRRWFTLLSTLLLSTLSIEFIQYFTGRSADIDDILMNFLGGLIGFFLYLILNRLFSSFLFWKKIKGQIHD